MFDLAQQTAAATPAMAMPTSGNTAAVTALSNKTYDIFAVPPTLTYTSSSNAATSSTTVTQYIFNNNVMNAAVTNNGSGASSITNTYGDGFTGKVYENGFRSWNGGRGILIKGFTLQVTNYTSGAQIGSYFNTLAFQLLNANFQGGTLNVPFDVSVAVNNQQYQVGIITVKQPLPQCRFANQFQRSCKHNLRLDIYHRGRQLPRLILGLFLHNQLQKSPPQMGFF